MAEIKKISTELQLLDKFLDTSGDAGTSGQVLTSTGTGINWVSGGSLPGGPYLPLTAGASYPLTGGLFGTTASFSNQVDINGFTNNKGLSFRTGFTPTNVGIMAKAIGTANRDGLAIFGYNGIDFVVNNGANVAMRIVGVTGSGMGNVGIGTTSPDGLLNLKHVTSTSSISEDASDYALTFNFAGTTNDYGRHIAIRDSNGDAVASIGGVDLGGAGTTGLYFATGSVSGISEAMRIDSTGKVGIGTSNPVQKFVVSNGTNGQGIEIVPGTSGIIQCFNRAASVYLPLFFDTLRFQARAVEYFTVSTGSGYTEKMRIIANGNVGIGTTNPLYKIHSSSSGARNDLQFTLDSLGTGSTDGAQLGIQAGGAYIWNFENNDLYFATNNSRVLSIKPSGNVGIGTTSPVAKLHVEGDKSYSLGYLDATSDLHIGNDTMSSAVGAYSGSITFGSTNESNLQAASIVAVQTDTDPNEIGLAFFTQHSSAGSTDLVESMRIKNDGKVGIGTTGPTTPLHVIGITQIVTGSDTAFYEGNGVRVFGTQSYRFRNSPGNVRAIINVEATGNNAGNIDLFNASSVVTTKLNNAGNSFLNGGNVGIGTTSPNSKLQIVGKATSSSTVSADAATTLVTKDYVDSSAGNPSHFRQGFKTLTVGTTFISALTVSLAAHTGCYVTLCCFGDWGSHSTAAYRGEFFLQNGGGVFNEPGIILRQDDNTSDAGDQIICQIVDPPGSTGNRDFVIQIRHTDTTSPISFSGTITFTVQGKFNSVT